MRFPTTLLVLAAAGSLAACAGRSGGETFVSAATPEQAAQCALGEAGELGYSLADGEPGGLRYRVRKSIPPRESTTWTTGILTIRAHADGQGRTVLRVDAERYVAGSTGTGRRAAPGSGPGIGGVVGGVRPDPDGNPDQGDLGTQRRVNPGPVAVDAGRIRRVCRTG